MRNFMFILSLLFLLPMNLCAQTKFKLEEQSSKSRPDWLTDNNYKGAFMVQANGMASIEDAQNAVMTSLLNQIASSVAVEVTGETVSDVNWLTDNDKDVFSQNIQSSTITRIAKMPALQGISITKAQVYWEYYVNKKTNESYYDYYILYPFSMLELEELIDAYNKHEKKINDKIDGIENQLNGIEEISVALKNIDEMKLMMQGMDNGDLKYYRLKNVLKQYNKFIDDIHVEVIENNKDLIVLQLRYDERCLKATSLPKVTGDCARDFNVSNDGYNIDIQMNTFDCYAQDDNYVTARFNFGDRKLMKKILINL
ncbi:MAG: hypothetical protein E7066_06495 [Lentimicrobiaceae bacterium]|nr:hypothetical protein [Lentimicrobiaceae bacterium]